MNLLYSLYRRKKHFPLFADERDDLAAALKKAIPKYKSDGMDVEEVSRLPDAGADPNQHHGGSEWSDMFGPVVYGLMGGVLGGAAGILIACLPPLYKGFNNYPVLYYAPAVVSAVIASVVVIEIWF